MSNNLLRVIGLLILLLGTAMSIYFDNASENDAHLEKIGYILFFTGLAISIKARSAKSNSDT
mgnify:CR=1 FL=1